MSKTSPNRAKSIWLLAWEPEARILPMSTESEPTKPPKPGSVGFEGGTSSQSSEIEMGPDLADLGTHTLCAEPDGRPHFADGRAIRDRCVD